MTDYIKRDDVIIAIKEHERDVLERGYRQFPSKSLNQYIADIPSADAIELKRGKWIDENALYRTAICSSCKKVTMFEEWGDKVRKYDFCPNCGARMKDAE